MKGLRHTKKSLINLTLPRQITGATITNQGPKDAFCGECFVGVAIESKDIALDAPYSLTKVPS